MTLTLLPPNLPPSFPPSSLTHSTICCSLSSQAALSALKQLSEQGLDPVDGPIKVRYDTDPRPMPHVTPCWMFYLSGRAHACVARSQTRTCQCGLLQILSCRLAHHLLRPEPPTHIQHFRSTFIPHRKSDSRRIYLHAAHCCQRVMLCMMAITTKAHSEKRAFST